MAKEGKALTLAINKQPVGLLAEEATAKFLGEEFGFQLVYLGSRTFRLLAANRHQ